MVTDWMLASLWARPSEATPPATEFAVLAPAMRFRRQTVTGYSSALSMYRNAENQEFQKVTASKSTIVAMTALLSGRTIRRRVPYGPRPSSAAASSSSSGMVSKKDVITSRLKTLIALGTTIAQMLLVKPSALMRT